MHHGGEAAEASRSLSSVVASGAPAVCLATETSAVDGTRAGGSAELPDAAAALDGEAARDAEDAEAAAQAVRLAEASARSLRAAAATAEDLAGKLPFALRRAAVAERRNKALEAEIAEARQVIEALQAQQLRLSEGFLGEIRQRDAEIRQRDAELGMLRAAASAAAASAASSAEVRPDASVALPDGGASDDAAQGGASEQRRTRTGAASAETSASAIEVFTMTTEGPWLVDLDRTNSCLKVVTAVDPSSPVLGRVGPGDELVSLNGASARNLSWEELDAALAERPLVVSVRRPEDDVATRESGAGAAIGSLLGSKARSLVGWARATASVAVREFALDADPDDVMAYEEGPTMSASAFLGEPSPTNHQSRVAAVEDSIANSGQEDAAKEKAKERNRPFYALVQSSMAEVCLEEARKSSLAAAGDEAVFEKWLRSFHSERDDAWYANNHLRLYNAFRPSWTEVVEAQRARVAC